MDTSLEAAISVLVKNLLNTGSQFFVTLAPLKNHYLLLPLFLIILISLQGCANHSSYLDTEAEHLGFSRTLITGTEFQHVIYTRVESADDSVLHVYLDGDGQPWIDHRLISADPTPENPLTLKLMGLDNTSSIYLGRPCYHGFSTTPPCDPALWTSARYSLKVVQSMQQALLNYLKRGNYHRVTLIGYSGGGTLAMLLAERIEAVNTVVTIAGNLDIDAWTEYHRYSPLVASINPALISNLDPSIQQYHLIGTGDLNIPYSLVKPFLQRQTNAKVLIQQTFDHTCCWHKIWPEFLKSLKT